jgi:glutamate dehydrogenase (NAD(P)+)
MEYRGGSQSAAFASIEEKVRANTEEMLVAARTNHILPREAAFQLAAERVRRCAGYRRWGIS